MGRSQLLDTDSQQDIMLSAGALYCLCLYWLRQRMKILLIRVGFEILGVLGEEI